MFYQAIHKIAKISFDANMNYENIGVRRLFQVL